MVDSSAQMRSYMEKLNENLSPLELNLVKKRFNSYFSVDERARRDWLQIDSDGVVNVDGDVYTKRSKSAEKLPVVFGKVNGEFNIRNVGLTSLVGSPRYIDGSFDCELNLLTSLVGGPQHVVGRYFCRQNDLTSLEGLPEKCKDLIISYNENLPLLRLVGLGYHVRIVNGDHPEHIIKKYQGKGMNRANILDCQKELIDAGFEGNASW